MQESHHSRDPFCDITNENTTTRPALSKGKRRSDACEGSSKRIKTQSESLNEPHRDSETHEAYPPRRNFVYRGHTNIHYSLRALRLGERVRFAPSTICILESFVSSNLSDLFKCHSLAANTFLTTPYACAYSNDSRAGQQSLLAVATEEGTVSIFNTGKRQIWDPENRRTALQIHNNGIFDVKWSNSDRLLATASGDWTVRITDPQSTSGEPIHDLRGGHSSTVKCLAWSPSHEALLASGGRDGNICLWDCRASNSEGPALTICHAHEPSPGRPERKGRVTLRPRTVTSLAYVPDNTFHIISGGAGDGKLRKWDVRKPTTKTPKIGKNVPLVCMSATDYTLSHSETVSAETLRSPRRARGICSIAVGRGPSAGQIFALCNDSRIHTYNASGAAEAPLDIPQEDRIYSHRHMATSSFYLRISVSPCGRWLAGGGAGGSAFLFDLAARGSHIQGVELKGQDGEITGVDWADNVLATCADDGTVRVWRPDVEKYHMCLGNPEEAQLDWAWGRR